MKYAFVDCQWDIHTSIERKKGRKQHQQQQQNNKNWLALNRFEVVGKVYAKNVPIDVSKSGRTQFGICSIYGMRKTHTHTQEDNWTKKSIVCETKNMG